MPSISVSGYSGASLRRRRRREVRRAAMIVPGCLLPAPRAHTARMLLRLQPGSSGPASADSPDQQPPKAAAHVCKPDHGLIRGVGAATRLLLLLLEEGRVVLGPARTVCTAQMCDRSGQAVGPDRKSRARGLPVHLAGMCRGVEGVVVQRVAVRPSPVHALSRVARRILQGETQLQPRRTSPSMPPTGSARGLTLSCSRPKDGEGRPRLPALLLPMPAGPGATACRRTIRQPLCLVTHGHAGGRAASTPRPIAVSRMRAL